MKSSITHTWFWSKIANSLPINQGGDKRLLNWLGSNLPCKFIRIKCLNWNCFAACALKLLQTAEPYCFFLDDKRMYWMCLAKPLAVKLNDYVISTESVLSVVNFWIFDIWRWEWGSNFEKNSPKLQFYAWFVQNPSFVWPSGLCWFLWLQICFFIIFNNISKIFSQNSDLNTCVYKFLLTDVYQL